MKQVQHDTLALAKKLRLENRKVFLLKNDLTHFRPARKSGYGQSLRKSEYEKIPSVIRAATFAVIDKMAGNFQLVFFDEQNSQKINKIVFNKDCGGNWIVTIGKVDRGHEFSEIKNIVVGAGVAPAISQLRKGGEVPATRLRPSPTT